MKDPSERSFVVVIGGGYGGINVARALDDHAHVTLVEPKDAFVHNIAALRALVEPTWLPRIFLPYDHLLEHGTVLRDRASHIDAEQIVLASGRRLRPEFIVLATGSSYPFPAKSDALSTFRGDGSLPRGARKSHPGQPGHAARRRRRRVGARW